MAVWRYGGMAVSSKAIREHRAGGGSTRESGGSAMPNVRVGHNVTTTAPCQRAIPETPPAAIQSETAA